jgi:hypothetical protein
MDLSGYRLFVAVRADKYRLPRLHHPTEVADLILFAFPNSNWLHHCRHLNYLSKAVDATAIAIGATIAR